MVSLLILGGLGLALIGIWRLWKDLDEHERHQGWLRDLERAERRKGIEQSCWQVWPFER